MSGGILRFPWTTQPQSPVDIDPKWLARGLTFLNLGNGRYWQKGKGWIGTGTVVGAPKNTAGKLGVSKGFGATLGTGTTDRIDAGFVPVQQAPYRSIVAHIFHNGGGGGGLGRIFQDVSGNGLTGGDESLYLNTGGAAISYVRRATTSNGQYVASSQPTGRWSSFGVSHNQTTVGVAPKLYIDAIESSVTVNTNSIGSFTATGTTLSWGNRADGARNWDGLIGPVAFFDCLLTAEEHKALNDNIWQLLAPVERKIWVPNAGGGGVSGTLATTNANDTSAATGTTTVTGTLATTNANDSSSASGTTTVTGTLATTNANDTSAASGSPVVVGTLATTNANDSVVASGDVGGNITGTVNYTNANDTGAASGTTTVTGSLATTNANDSASASGTTTVTGTSAYTNANDTVAASGAAGTVTGTVNVTNDNDTSAASGTAGNPVIASQGGGGWLPQTRRKSRKQIYEERVKLGILPPPVIKAAAKVAAVAQTVEEFKEDRPKYEEMFLKAIKKTEWLPDYTRAIQAAIMELEQEEEELLMLL